MHGQLPEHRFREQLVCCGLLLKYFLAQHTYLASRNSLVCSIQLQAAATYFHLTESADRGSALNSRPGEQQLQSALNSRPGEQQLQSALKSSPGEQQLQSALNSRPGEQQLQSALNSRPGEQQLQSAKFVQPIFGNNRCVQQRQTFV
jgi:flagellar motor protein MotB